MLTDNATLVALIQSINVVLDDLKSQKSPISNTRRQTLIKDAERLTIAAREPEENLYFQATQVKPVNNRRTRIEHAFRDSKTETFGALDCSECRNTYSTQHGRLREALLQAKWYECS